jgi:hypothetical protein
MKQLYRTSGKAQQKIFDYGYTNYQLNQHTFGSETWTLRTSEHWKLKK